MHHFKSVAEPRVQLGAAGLGDGGKEQPREVSTCWVGWLIQRAQEQTSARPGFPGHELGVKSCSTGLSTILVGLDKRNCPYNV